MLPGPALSAWIEDLRGRLERAAPLQERLLPGAVRMQENLADDLSLLYERLVEGKPYSPITYRTQRSAQSAP